MIKYILLGIIQGFTEFFPVSSSAHLVIAQKLLGISGDEVALSIVLHLGTVLALLVFFFKDILEVFLDRKQIGLLLIVTVITGTIGVLGKDFFESLFTQVSFSAYALIVTGIMLILVRKFIEGRRLRVGIKDALILGFTQGIAIIPGISRSGITISTLLFRGVDKFVSFRISFLVAIPVILGAALLELKHIDSALKADFSNLALGFVFSFLAGIFSLLILKKVLAKAKLHYFGYYCIIIAIITLLFVK
jgi:undecaprenyl-diphosphatase